MPGVFILVYLRGMPFLHPQPPTRPPQDHRHIWNTYHLHFLPVSHIQTFLNSVLKKSQLCSWANVERISPNFSSKDSDGLELSP